MSVTTHDSNLDVSQEILSAVSSEAKAAIVVFQSIQRRCPSIGLSALQDALFALADAGALQIDEHLRVQSVV